jgi:hypothetical protein
VSSFADFQVHLGGHVVFRFDGGWNLGATAGEAPGQADREFPEQHQQEPTFTAISVIPATRTTAASHPAARTRHATYATKTIHATKGEEFETDCRLR